MNLEVVFGTQKIWKMFLPSVRTINYDGFNWPSEIYKEPLEHSELNRV